ncbi:MAG: elongation factor G [Ruminococcaceae bacterium]|nr:elongation factor G [Oscillospiraceae bacterium]
MAATKDIRNVCLISHGNAGKTSLVEAMLYNGKLIDRFGRIEDGNTVSDYDSEEIKRKISVNTSLISFDWNDKKMNILDTPGFFDFVGEQIEAASVCENCIITVSGKSGVSAGTEKAWRLAEKYNLGKIIFVNKLDDIKADYIKVIEQLNDTFGKAIAPFTFPIKDGDFFCGFVDVIKMKAKMFTGNDATYEDIPEAYLETAQRSREILNEAIAECSDELMEKFFAGEEFTESEIKDAIKTGIKNGIVVPVICGSTWMRIGITHVLSLVSDYLFSPDDAEAAIGKDAKTGDEKEIECKSDAPLVLKVFKTVVDNYVGKMSFFKVVSGKLTPDTTLYNANKEENEKIGKLYTLRGKKQIEVPFLEAGDIGVAAKLAFTETGDTLSDPKAPVILDAIEFPKPVLSMAIVPKSKGDEEKISQGLSKLMDEDKTFTLTSNKETGETVISGLGEQHLNVICSKLLSKFGVDVTLKDPKIAYRETIRKKVKVEGKHKKQSGGHGQYGHVWIEFEPCESEDLIFEEKVFGGSVPKNYFPAVEKGLRESMAKGVLAGYPVINLKATLLDGSYHPVDSSEMAFKTAASICYKTGLEQANPVILEPIGMLKAKVRNDYTGDVTGDINKRRGRILGMNPLDGGETEIEALIPSSEMTKYATDLRAITNGRGSFTFELDHYEEVPAHLVDKIKAEAKEQ